MQPGDVIARNHASVFDDGACTVGIILERFESSRFLEARYRVLWDVGEVGEVSLSYLCDLYSVIE